MIFTALLRGQDIFEMRFRAHLLVTIDLPLRELALACRTAPEMQLSVFDNVSQRY